MEPLGEAIPAGELMAELSRIGMLRKTNNANNEVYLFDHHSSSLLMHELGRIRELTFRHAGGGTGKALDLDEYDLDPDHPQKQLIIWDPENREIIGGYRFIFPGRKEKGFSVDRYASSGYFTMELGRSFVRPEYQSGAMGRKSLYALDNLWDGLGAIIIDNRQIKFLFGKVTMYTHYNVQARNMILYFMLKYFPDPEKLAVPDDPIILDIHEGEMKQLFTGRNFKEDLKILSQEVRRLGENIPPLINAYMNLSPSMRCFGTFINHHFGNVEETGILITVRDIYIDKINRHLASYRANFKISQ
jgi:hypothetical protein